MNRKSQIIINYAKAVTPPVLWRMAQRLLQHNDQPKYQGVLTIHSMRWLHEGRFAEIYDHHRQLDPFIGPNETRLRLYIECMFAEFSKDIPGDFLSAGISYGVAPRVIYDYVAFERLGKIYHFIDPFLGVNNPDETNSPFNTDFDFVRRQYSAQAPVKFHLELIPDCFPLAGLNALAFVHMNTTDAVAEAASLPYLYEKLSPGGFILIDYYSFAKGHFDCYDPAIEKIGASVFSMISGQGVIRKPLN